MIEILGQANINTAVKAGLDKFYSILTRPVVDRSGGALAPRAYTKTRGILIRKDFLDRKDVNIATQGYYFQFNPDKVSDSKSTEYSVVSYPGLNYNDYAWGHGGERIISFQLFLDNTPQSHTEQFRPEAYGSAVSKPIIKEGSEISWEELGQIKTRISQRGVMDDVDKITQFLYPAYAGDSRPLFASGGIVDDKQFTPPATAVLVLGPRYFEGIVKSAPVEYTLFDTDLTPLRATVNVEFAAYEFFDVSTLYKKKLGND